MLQEKSKAIASIKYRVNKLQFDKEKKAKVINLIHDKFNIPTGIISDYFDERLLYKDANNYLLFAMAYGVDEVCETKIVEENFSELEIKTFSTTKMETEEFKFPIAFQCIQVSTDQWIGTSDVKTLMKLRDAQLINYNKNTQRTLQRVVRGDKEYFKIAINNKAVTSIEKAYNAYSFIPNTIPLNIPYEELDFGYDAKEKELVVSSVPYFDITDGYHRFLAMTRIYDKDPEFNYPIELRITHFSEDRTRQFIYQEDQKTKMRKIDSDSMDTQAPENVIVERLNTNMNFYWRGEVLRNEGRINFGEMARVIKWFYFKGKKTDNRYMIQLEKDLIEKLNAVIAGNDKLMEEKISFVDLMIIFYCLTEYDNTTEAGAHINNGLRKADKLKEMRMFSTKVPRKGMLKELREIV